MHHLENSLPALLLAVALLAIGCGRQVSQSYYLETRSGEAAYAKVNCAHEANPDGFSVEFPRCFCNGGVKLDYVVERVEGQPVASYFVLRRGYLSDRTPDITIVTRDGYTIDRLLVQASARPTEMRRTRKNRTEWQRNEQLLAEIMAEYAPRLYEIEMLCKAQAITSS